ncbi:MAG: c-type cytochrome [Candidatus Zixiibacteriota bacterium]
MRSGTGQRAERRWLGAVLAGVGIAAGAFFLASCGERTTDMDMQMFQAATVEEETLIRGREAYMLYCVGCHGENGDGAGAAAGFLEPKPRDFTKGTFKFASVPSGDLARDEDLLRVIQRGLPGSSMPSWRLLDDATQRALVAYIKAFSERYTHGQAGEALPVPPDPYRNNHQAGIDRGRIVYHGIAGCYQCHPAYVTPEEIRMAAELMGTPPPQEFAATLYEEKPKISDLWGYDIRPPDFTRRRLKNGDALEDLMRVIQAGVGGTAMPTWAGILEPADLWAMAHYVKSLADLRGTPEGKQLLAELKKAH